MRIVNAAEKRADIARIATLARTFTQAGLTRSRRREVGKCTNLDSGVVSTENPELEVWFAGANAKDPESEGALVRSLGRDQKGR